MLYFFRNCLFDTQSKQVPMQQPAVIVQKQQSFQPPQQQQQRTIEQQRPASQTSVGKINVSPNLCGWIDCSANAQRVEDVFERKSCASRRSGQSAEMEQLIRQGFDLPQVTKVFIFYDHHFLPYLTIV